MGLPRPLRLPTPLRCPSHEGPHGEHIFKAPIASGWGPAGSPVAVCECWNSSRVWERREEVAVCRAAGMLLHSQRAPYEALGLMLITDEGPGWSLCVLSAAHWLGDPRDASNLPPLIHSTGPRPDRWLSSQIAEFGRLIWLTSEKQGPPGNPQKFWFSLR